jgi:polysaccharide export outer membrane protein
MNKQRLKWIALFLASAIAVVAQQPAQQPGGGVGPQPPGQQQPALRPDYVLGPNDQILVRSPQAEEINEKPFRVDADGFVTLPIAGKIKAAGLTVQALEAQIAAKLREFIREPQVSITLVQFRSDPVFFVGSFKFPGIYPLQGKRTLVEMLTAIGGIQPNASRRIRVTRKAEFGPIDLPNAVENREKRTSSVDINLESLTQDINPAADILLQPYDIVSVERSERIYVAGDVTKAGPIEVAEREYVSLTQAIAEAGGFTNLASQDKVRVLRPVLGTSRRAEIVVDMKRVLSGREIDFPLMPNDVVWVPRSGLRGFGAPLVSGLVTSLPYVLITALLR